MARCGRASLAGKTCRAGSTARWCSNGCRTIPCRERATEVQDVLHTPDEVRQSRSDPAVFLFYRAELSGRRVCAVTKRLNDEGFLITTYPTDAIKEGERVWSR